MGVSLATAILDECSANYSGDIISRVVVSRKNDWACTGSAPSLEMKGANAPMPAVS